MKWSHLQVVTTMMFVFILSSLLFATDIPIAMYTTRDDVISQDIHALKDTLGVNYIYGEVGRNYVSSFKNAGFGLIKWHGENNLVNRLSGESYFSVSLADSTTLPQFGVRHGHVDQTSGFWVPDTGMALDMFYFAQYGKSAFAEEDSFPRQFFIKVRMKIDPEGVSNGDLLGIVYVNRLDSVHADTACWGQRAAISIRADDSLLTGRVFEVPQDTSYTLCDSTDCNLWQVKYSYQNTGVTTIYLDSLKCYNQTGLEVMAGEWNQRIADSVTTAPWDSIDYWWLRDEPKYDWFSPYGKVRAVLNAGQIHKSIGAYLKQSIVSSFDSSDWAHELQTFETLTNQDKIVVNDYPFGGGYEGGHFVDYTGYSEHFDSTNADHRGLQLELQDINELLFGVVRGEIAREGSPLQEFWYSPQWFWSYCDGPWNPPETGYIWRRPTRSELRMQIGLGLSYGTKGFNIWRYDYGETDRCDPGIGNMQGGFYDNSGNRDALFWQTMRDEINPYLKAIGNTYTSITWQRTYPYNPIHKSTPPSGAYITSMSAISDSIALNPDLGWFHVGEFDSSGAKYIMLVNRACSQGQWNPAEAPSITATVRLNVSNLGLGNYVYIIDLATGIDSADWVGSPDTTYSSVMPDGTIPFTTTLKAGEGRLYKIAAAPKRRR